MLWKWVMKALQLCLSKSTAICKWDFTVTCYQDRANIGSKKLIARVRVRSFERSSPFKFGSSSSANTLCRRGEKNGISRAETYEEKILIEPTKTILKKLLIRDSASTERRTWETSRRSWYKPNVYRREKIRTNLPVDPCKRRIPLTFPVDSRWLFPVEESKASRLRLTAVVLTTIC